MMNSYPYVFDRLLVIRVLILLIKNHEIIRGLQGILKRVGFKVSMVTYSEGCLNTNYVNIVPFTKLRKHRGVNLFHDYYCFRRFPKFFKANLSGIFVSRHV